jgi:hypothetical protein
LYHGDLVRSYHTAPDVDLYFIMVTW